MSEWHSDQKNESEGAQSGDLLEITLKIPTETGKEEDSSECKLLRTQQWLDKRFDPKSNTVFFSLAELGVVNERMPLVSVKPASKIKSGKGQIVRATINRVSSNLYDLEISSQSKLIRGTGEHPFWSVTRRAWVNLENLTVGELLQLQSGVTTSVIRTEEGLWSIQGLQH